MNDETYLAALRPYLQGGDEAPACQLHQAAIARKRHQAKQAYDAARSRKHNNALWQPRQQMGARNLTKAADTKPTQEFSQSELYPSKFNDEWREQR